MFAILGIDISLKSNGKITTLDVEDLAYRIPKFQTTHEMNGRDCGMFQVQVPIGNTIYLSGRRKKKKRKGHCLESSEISKFHKP